MEGNCSFLAISGEQCGYDRRDRSKSANVIQLTSCNGDITGHMSTLGCHDTSNEMELLLARCSIFSTPKNIEQMVICPAHRSSLGTGWRRDSANCSIPDLLSSHRSSKRPKAERGPSKAGSWLVLRETGIFLPVGTGMFIS